MILALMTSLYGDVYLLVIDSRVSRSDSDNLTTYGLFLGMMNHSLMSSSCHNSHPIPSDYTSSYL